MTHHSLVRVSACALALAAGPVLTGCSGVVKNLNSAQVTVPNIKVANPFGFSNQTASVTLANPTGQVRAAALKAHATGSANIFPFQKQTISLSNLSSATLAIALQPTVTLTGTSLPASFTLTSFTTTVEVDDLTTPAAGLGVPASVDDSLVLPDPATGGTGAVALTLVNPVHFTLQAGSTDVYTADAATPFALQPLTVQGTDLTHLVTIVTGENASKQAIVTLAATGTGVASGTTAQFTFGDTSLTVSANGS